MATVLVVEDDKLSQRILDKILRGAGHRSLLTATVEEASVALRQQVLVDLVILDNQLGQSWGWQFLEKLREDVLFQELPAVVYTGHTERSSILRYVQLGVTSMLVKPYKAETIVDEVAKAVKAGWADSVIEPAAVACKRLKLTEPDYYSVLSAGATALEKIHAELSAALSARHGEPPIRELVSQLQSQSVSLGMPLLRKCADALAKAASKRDKLTVLNCLQTIDTLRALLRRRALDYVGIDEMAAPPATHGTGGEKPAKASRRLPVAGPLDLFRRETVTIPIWQFGRALQRLGGNRFFGEGQFDELVVSLSKKPPFASYVELVQFTIEAAQSSSFEDLESEIGKEPRFKATFLGIASRLVGQPETDEPEMDVALAINRLGLYKTVALLAAGRLADALRLPSPLDLDMLRIQTISVSLLAYEIGRMLSLQDDHLLAAAGAVHNIGTWVFAISEPVLYAVALGMAEERGSSLDAAEKEMFGVTHHDAGRMLLNLTPLPGALLESAKNYAYPENVSRIDVQSVVSCVYLANELVWIETTGDENSADLLRTRLLGPTNPIWTVLQKNRVVLPMDIPEFVDALAIAAKTSVWIARVLTGQDLP